MRAQNRGSGALRALLGGGGGGPSARVGSCRGLVIGVVGWSSRGVGVDEDVKFLWMFFPWAVCKFLIY